MLGLGLSKSHFSILAKCLSHSRHSGRLSSCSCLYVNVSALLARVEELFRLGFAYLTIPASCLRLLMRSLGCRQ